MERIAALQRVLFLKALSREILNEINEMGRIRLLSAGEVLFLEKDPCLGLPVVLEGAVKVCRVVLGGGNSSLVSSGLGLASEISPFSTAETTRRVPSQLTPTQDCLSPRLLRSPASPKNTLPSRRAQSVRLRSSNED